MIEIQRVAVSDRITFLKKQLRSRQNELCSERAVLITEAYQEFANDPIIIKKGKGSKADTE
jgi:hypothetical protein